MITIENFDKIRYYDICGGWYVKQESTQQFYYYLECEELNDKNIPVDSKTFIIDRRLHLIYQSGWSFSSVRLEKEHLISCRALIGRINEMFFLA